jgi:hypothetical protein
LKEKVSKKNFNSLRCLLLKVSLVCNRPRRIKVLCQAFFQESGSSLPSFLSRKRKGDVRMIGNIIVIAIVAAVAALAARSLWKSHKSGGSCGGDCSCCHGCHSQEKQ